MLLDQNLRDNFGSTPNVQDWLYADAWLRKFKVKYPAPKQRFWYREPGLYLPLSCAIALDTAVGGPNGVFIDSSWNHTTGTGSNFIILIAGWGDTSVDDSSVTIDGSSTGITKIRSHNTAGDRYVSLWWKGGLAASTTYAVVFLHGSSTFCSGGSITYTDASQTGVPDASDQAAGESKALVTTVDNCWVVGVDKDSSGVSSGTLRVGNGSTARTAIADSNGVITPAGSFTITMTGGGDNIIVASLAPVIGGGPSIVPKSITIQQAVQRAASH